MAISRDKGLSVIETARYFAEGSYLKAIGSPETIANQMQEWFDAGACDGFLAIPTHYPTGVKAFTTMVVPELQRRDIFRSEYTGTQLRDHLGLTKY